MPKKGKQTPPDAQVENTGKQGRPAYNDEQYLFWLESMRPWLENASSLHYAAQCAGIQQHYRVIAKKYAEKGWFSAKVDAYRSQPGEIGNEAEITLVRQINDKVKRKEIVTRQEIDILKHFNEKHRSAQPFFVTRAEVAQADPKDVGKVLDVLESEESDYEQLGSQAKKQILAANAPVQNQEQTGQDSQVSAQPDSVEASS